MDDQDPVCIGCISDKFLRAWVEQRGEERTCAYCGNEAICCDIETLAAEIDDVMRRYYQVAPEEPHVADWTDNLVYYADGETAKEIIAPDVIESEEAAAHIVRILSAKEWHDVKDGDDAFYDNIPLRHIRAYADEFLGVWDEFEHRLKHQVRFFDAQGRQMLDKLFGDLPNLGGGRAIVTLDPVADAGTKLYRAQIIAVESKAEDFVRDPARHIGPPPADIARAGRMNPAGIPAFYGAFSKDVALAEIRPPVGSLVAIGEFSILQPIKLLDMSFLPFAYHEETMFSPSYDEARSKIKFLEVFHRRISRPVLPTDEALAYLPTQAVAAYVTHVMGLNGIIYSSTQIGAEGESTGGQLPRTLCNIVLFESAALVERTPAPPRPPDPHPFDAPLLPIVGLRIDARPRNRLGYDDGAPNAIEDPAPAVPERPAAEPPHDDAVAQNANAPAAAGEQQPQPGGLTEDGRPATLRVRRDPELERVRAVKVETSGVFAHLYENGLVIIDERDEEDDE